MASNKLVRRPIVVPSNLASWSLKDLCALEDKLEDAYGIISEYIDSEIRRLVGEGWTQAQIGKECGRDQSTISDRMRRLGISPASRRGRPRIMGTHNSRPPIEELAWEDLNKLDIDELIALIEEEDLDIDTDDMDEEQLCLAIAETMGIPYDEEEEEEREEEEPKPKPKRNRQPSDKDAITVAQWKTLSPIKKADILNSGGNKSFNQTKESVGWAKWTWNPITGCLHNCPYCYAREIAHQKYNEVDPFLPKLRPSRLTAPRNTNIPKAVVDDPGYQRVFTGSMADIFGKWVPQAWIDRIFEEITAAPQFEFLMLTKFPQRLAQLEWPDNVWAGTTVDKQHRVDLAQRSFADVKAGVKWLSCEPLLEDLKFDSLEMFDWVVIGSQTATNQPDGRHPEQWAKWDHVVNLYWQAREAGCKVYLKHNLILPAHHGLPGIEPIQEWPR